MWGRGEYFDMSGFYDEKVADKDREKYRDARSDVPSGIISRLNDGEHDAFEYIYLHYYDSLTDFLSALLQSREDAREIAQEVFANVWVKRGMFDPQKGIKRYLYYFAKLLALSHFEKMKVQDKYKEFASRADICDLSPDDTMEGKEAALLADIVISRMPPRQREVFLLNREQGMSYEEIAAHLGIGRNKVRNYISKSLKELREVLTMLVVLFFR